MDEPIEVEPCTLGCIKEGTERKNGKEVWGTDRAEGMRDYRNLHKGSTEICRAL